VSRRSERGQAALELVGLLPLLLLFGSFALQAGAAMWTASSVSEAARSSARAYSLGGDPVAAAGASLPGGLRVKALSYVGPGHGVRLSADVPRVSLLPTFTVTRQVVLP
jgi:hypothetical protein